jgi:hypothetical protein
MKPGDSLFLYEQVLLLALRDREGTIAWGTMYQYGLGGALLAELLLGGHIRVEHHRKKKLVEVVSTGPIGEPLLDHCLDAVRKAKRRATLQTWVSRFTAIKRLKHRAAEQLCTRGILRGAEDRVLIIFSRKVYPEIDPRPERLLIDQLRRAIFSDSGTVDPRTAVLVALAHHAGLLKNVFEKRQLKARKTRIKQIVSGDATGNAVKEAIEAVQAAAAVATIVAASGSH